MTATTGHRVGLLFSHESLTAATEITQENATLLAIDEVNAYPGLETPLDSPVVTLLRLINESREPTFKVAFGTEGGLFQDRLGLATAVCGPGFMAQGHKPDEYVGADQLGRCDAMLAALVDRLAVGL